MVQLLAGIALGWMAFTPEGRKTANEVMNMAKGEIRKTLVDTGIMKEDDVPGKNNPE